MADNWSDVELAAAVEAYQNMAALEDAQKPYSKKDVYRGLAAQFDRTEKSFEYRMQNISAVLHGRNERWIPGLKPAGNVGTDVKARIESLLISTRKQPPTKLLQPAPYKKKLFAMREWLIRVGRRKGVVTYGEMMDVFKVDRFSLRHAMDFLGHEADNLDEPILTALIVSKRTRRCSPGLAKEFVVHDDELERERLYKYWEDRLPETNKTEMSATDLESRAVAFAIVATRPGQAKFRREVFEQYGGKCVISGCSVDKALDAAHKHGRDWREGHNSATDGYLMRKDLHAMYDKGSLKITEDGIIELGKVDGIEHYQEFAGKKLAEEYK